METNRQANIEAVRASGTRRMAALCMAVLLALTLCGCTNGNTAVARIEMEETTLYGKIDADGTAYLPVMDGTTVTIPGDVCRAMLLKDRTTIVVLERDGLLYATTVSATEQKTVIAEDAEAISDAAVHGVVYKNGKGEYFRYLFADGSTVSLGKNIVYRIGADSLSLLFADDQGKIYLLPQDAAEPETVGSYEDTVLMGAVSSDGKTAVWTEKDTDADTHTTCIYMRENCNRLETVSSEYCYVTPRFNRSETLLAIADVYDSNFCFTTMEQDEITTAKLGNELHSSSIYTKNGLLRNDSAQIIDGLYALVEADSNASIYYISADGDREKVAGNVTDMEIAGGRLYYLDDESNLYTAKLKGSELLEETKIAGDVDLFKLSADGSYAYYLKNTEENAGVLSRYNANKGESEKISSDAYSYISSYYASWGIAYFYVSEDGKSVYFFEDVEEDVGDSYINVGTLKCATEGAETVRIATDVIVANPDSALRDGYVRSDGFAFEKYLFTDEDGEFMVNWMYYNGRESQTIAKEVYHSVSAVTSSLSK